VNRAFPRENCFGGSAFTEVIFASIPPMFTVPDERRASMTTVERIGRHEPNVHLSVSVVKISLPDSTFADPGPPKSWLNVKNL